LKATSISLGAALDRMDAGIVLAGEHAECDLDGLFYTDGERHADNRTVIEHAVPNCKSRQVYKGILSDHSSAVFMGRVIVRPDAQKTDADQSNPNLLLSDDATVHTRPQLEIYADDVRCTHGATVGRLDEDALFYLRSRGIGPSEATNLLVKAFGGDILNRIDDETVRLHLERELDSRLPAASGSKG
jgi:Fe-S cluster assembly protein SufD